MQPLIINTNNGGGSGDVIYSPVLTTVSAGENLLYYKDIFGSLPYVTVGTSSVDFSNYFKVKVSVSGKVKLKVLCRTQADAQGLTVTPIINNVERTDLAFTTTTTTTDFISNDLEVNSGDTITFKAVRSATATSGQVDGAGLFIAQNTSASENVVEG